MMITIVDLCVVVHFTVLRIAKIVSKIVADEGRVMGWFCALGSDVWVQCLRNDA